jgi:hypothetical protein
MGKETRNKERSGLSEGSAELRRVCVLVRRDGGTSLRCVMREVGIVANVRLEWSFG